MLLWNALGLSQAFSLHGWALSSTVTGSRNAGAEPLLMAWGTHGTPRRRCFPSGPSLPGALSTLRSRVHCERSQAVIYFIERRHFCKLVFQLHPLG